jgi:hypothetical protein
MTRGPRSARGLRADFADLFGAHHLDHGPRQVLLFLCLGGALALAGGVVVAWHAGFYEVAAHFRNPHVLWFPLALAGAVAAHVGYVLAYREIARVDEAASIGALHAGALVATGFGVFFPRGGFALDLEALRDLGIPPREARVRVLGLGSLEYLVLATAACVCSFLLLVSGSHAHRAVTLSWAVGVPLGSGLALLALRFRDAICRGPLRPRQHGAAALVGMTLYWAGEVFVLWACIAAFSGRTPSVTAVVVGYATGYALTRRTLPLAGAGAVEVALPFALSWVGFALAPAVLAVFAYRIFNVWLPVGPALAGLVALRRRPLAADAEVGRDDRDAATVERARSGRDVDG